MKIKSSLLPAVFLMSLVLVSFIAFAEEEITITEVEENSGSDNAEIDVVGTDEGASSGGNEDNEKGVEYTSTITGAATGSLDRTGIYVLVVLLVFVVLLFFLVRRKS